MTAIVRDIAVPEQWDRQGLPGWCYHSEELLLLEKTLVFRSHWQIACHVSDIPEPGNYLALDVMGERALILRDQDGVVNAFHNICRHRGSRLVADETGTCKNALVCPFHGWVYNLDGTLRGAARPKSFPPLDKDEFALKKIEAEIWNGLVFIRFRPGPQPDVATLMAPFAEELSHYGIGDMVPVEGGIWSQISEVNWKSVRDVDNEGYHVAMAHPALQDLYGQTYYDEPFVNGLSRSFATWNSKRTRRWSVRNYVNIAEENPNLPESHRKAWAYFGIFPNVVIGVTPESVQFYQEFPISVSRSLLRGGIYRYKNETRRAKAARYLAARIDRETQAEDVQLTIWSNEAMRSEAFSGFYLSDLEYGVRSHHDHLRAILPVMTLEESPGEGNIAATNAKMLAQNA